MMNQDRSDESRWEAAPALPVYFVRSSNRVSRVTRLCQRGRCNKVSVLPTIISLTNVLRRSGTTKENGDARKVMKIVHTGTVQAHVDPFAELSFDTRQSGSSSQLNVRTADLLQLVVEMFKGSNSKRVGDRRADDVSMSLVPSSRRGSSRCWCDALESSICALQSLVPPCR